MTRRTIRVLWLTKGLGRGGAEMLLLNTARHLDRALFELDLVYFRGELSDMLEDFRSVGIEPRLASAWPVARPLGWLPQIRRLVASGSFDVIHVHSPQIAAMARTARMTVPRSRRPALVYSEHSARYRATTEILRRLTAPLDDRVIAVSEDALRSAPKATRRRASVLHHGIDRDMVVSGLLTRLDARTHLGVHEHDVVVGSISNLRPEKNHRLLLESVQPLLAGEPAVRLVIIGDGVLRADLQATIADLSLDTHVVLTGSVPAASRLLPAFDVFALSSIVEGLPVALMEALAAGVPIVATNVGGIHELLTDEVDALVVPCGDAPAFTAALQRLLADAHLRERLAAAGRERVRSLDAKATTAAIADLYRELVDEHRARGRPP